MLRDLAAEATSTVEQLVDKFWQNLEGEGRYMKNGKPTSERSYSDAAPPEY